MIVCVIRFVAVVTKPTSLAVFGPKRPSVQTRPEEAILDHRFPSLLFLRAALGGSWLLLAMITYNLYYGGGICIIIAFVCALRPRHLSI